MPPPDPAAAVRISSEIREAFPSQVEHIEAAEREAAAWESRFTKARTVARWEEENRQRDGIITARRQVAHLMAACAVRILDLTDGLAVLINAHRTHAAFPVTRSIVETAGVPAYTLTEVIPRIEKGRAAPVEETLRRLIMGVDPGAGMDAGEAPIRVSKLVDALGTVLDTETKSDLGLGASFRREYSFVTDNSHPNHHANHLTSFIDDTGTMDWNRNAGWREEDLAALVLTAEIALWTSGRAFDHVLKRSQHRLVLPPAPDTD